MGAVLHAALRPHDRSTSRTGVETYVGGDPCVPRRLIDVAGGDVDLGHWRVINGRLLPQLLQWRHPFATVVIRDLRWQR
jgi:hypothetical protein